MKYRWSILDRQLHLMFSMWMHYFRIDGSIALKIYGGIEELINEGSGDQKAGMILAIYRIASEENYMRCCAGKFPYKIDDMTALLKECPSSGLESIRSYEERYVTKLRRILDKIR